jgi:hypothetical protein
VEEVACPGGRKPGDLFVGDGCQAGERLLGCLRFPSRGKPFGAQEGGREATPGLDRRFGQPQGGCRICVVERVPGGLAQRPESGLMIPSSWKRPSTGDRHRASGPCPSALRQPAAQPHLAQRHRQATPWDRRARRAGQSAAIRNGVDINPWASNA